jgi:ATP-dependent helicase/nuclease subunit B
MAGRVFAMLEAFGVRETLGQWMKNAEAENDLERRDEHEQIWSEFVQLFDHMVDLLGDEPITLVDFIDVLDSGLESFDLALTPVKVDEILVGQIDRTRPPELKMVFVLGMNEGSFPRLQTERCVITDGERRSLAKRNIDLDPDSERRLLDERFLAYLAFTRASQKLIVSRSTADTAGRATNPSSFWFELQRLAPAMPIQHIARLSSSDAQNIGTPRQLVTELMRWIRAGAPSNPLWPALYQWLVTSTANDRVDAMRDQAWPALQYTNTATLSAASAGQLFPSPLQVKVKQLETLAECPFRHFAKYGLNLRDRDEPDVTGMDLSNAYHDILENLVRDVLETKTDWCSLKPAEAKQMIRLHAAEIGRRLRGELMLSTARNRYLLDRIEQNLQQAVATMTEIHRRGKYRPAFAALRFGDGGTLPAHIVQTPAGQSVHLHGQIDRVDLNDKGTGFIVADYKMAAGPLALDRVYHGLSLQLLTYLLVIQANGQELVGRKLSPAAAFLLQLLRSPQRVEHPSEAISPDDPTFPLRVMPRGIIDDRAIKSLDQNLTTGSSVVINVFINKTGERGRPNATDAADKAQFEAVLRHVEKRLGELADQITTGDIAVAPYMIAKKTPCPRCEFRSVCRFEPGLNRYRMLAPMKREEVLEAVTGRSPAAGQSPIT